MEVKQITQIPNKPSELSLLQSTQNPVPTVNQKVG
jgi:hypothetical protein